MFFCTILTCQALSAPPADAADPLGQVICAPSSDMTLRLSGRLKAQKTASGMRSPEEILEVWTDDHGAWAMVVRYASGTACIVAMGDDWHRTQG